MRNWIVITSFIVVTGCNATPNSQRNVTHKSFSKSELKQAADVLGLNCVISKTTYSRLKKEVCTGEAVRLIRQQARILFIEQQNDKAI